jgi:outer membrane lipoprotein LolB
VKENSPRVPIEPAGKAARAVITRLASAFVLMALLAACATQRAPGLPPLSDWETRQAVLADHPEWSFSGSIGVRAGTEGFNGQIRWHQVDNGFSATVSGPLGAGTVAFSGDGQQITIIDKTGEAIELVDAEEDLRSMYGWTIPVGSLRYWALGIPDPANPANTEFGDDGQLRHLEQRNWSVDISEYREVGGELMPRRIVAVDGDAKVTVFIRRRTFF